MIERGGILTLDLASQTGWAYAPPSILRVWPRGVWRPGVVVPPVVSGTHRIAPPKTAFGQFFAAFEDWLGDQIWLYRPDAVVFEAPLPHQSSQDAARRALGLVATTEKVCHQKGIRAVREQANNTVKKHFTGNGRAQKPDMLKACRDRGWNPTDDNEGDAQALLELAVRLLVHKEVLPS